MTEALGYVGKEVTVKVLGDDGKFYYPVRRSSYVTYPCLPYRLSPLPPINHTACRQLVGKEVTVKVLGDDGKFYYAKGKVESAEMQDGDAKIVIGLFSIPCFCGVNVACRNLQIPQLEFIYQQMKRIESRNIEILDSDMLQRLNDGIEIAAEKLST